MPRPMTMLVAIAGISLKCMNVKRITPAKERQTNINNLLNDGYKRF